MRAKLLRVVNLSYSHRHICVYRLVIRIFFQILNNFLTSLCILTVLRVISSRFLYFLGRIRRALGCIFIVTELLMVIVWLLFWILQDVVVLNVDVLLNLRSLSPWVRRIVTLTFRMVFGSKLMVTYLIKVFKLFLLIQVQKPVFQALIHRILDLLGLLLHVAVFHHVFPILLTDVDVLQNRDAESILKV